MTGVFGETNTSAYSPVTLSTTQVLDKSIPWYQTIGNHDQYWLGTLFVDETANKAYVAETVMDIGITSYGFPLFDADHEFPHYYVGVIDGTTKNGDVIDYGDTRYMATSIVAADKKRRALFTETSTSLNGMKEFFKTSSKPKGHGFTQDNLNNDFASYTFEPRADVPIKVIVQDDTCKENPLAKFSSYARACLDHLCDNLAMLQFDSGDIPFSVE